MRKSILLPLGTVLAGGAGFLLRRWERAGAFDGETGLFSFGHPATLLLLALTLVAAVALLVLCRGPYPACTGGYALFLCRENSTLSLLLGGSAVLVLASALFRLIGLPETYRLGYAVALQFQMGASPAMTAAIPLIPQLITSVAALAAAPCLILLARSSRQGVGKGQSNGLLLPPILLYCTWLLAFYFDERSNPILADYGWGLLTAVACLLGVYCAASFSFQSCRPKAAAFFSLLGLYGALVTLADGRPVYVTLFYLSAALLMAFHSAGLLRWAEGSAPPPNTASAAKSREA